MVGFVISRATSATRSASGGWSSTKSAAAQLATAFQSAYSENSIQRARLKPCGTADSVGTAATERSSNVTTRRPSTTVSDGAAIGRGRSPCVFQPTLRPCGTLRITRRSSIGSVWSHPSAAPKTVPKTGFAPIVE